MVEHEEIKQRAKIELKIFDLEQSPDYTCKVDTESGTHVYFITKLQKQRFYMKKRENIYNHGN